MVFIFQLQNHLHESMIQTTKILILFLLLLHTPPATSAGSCIAGFTGSNCDILTVNNSNFPCGSGGSCILNTSTWGGGVAFDTLSNQYHMYSALISKGCTLDQWLTNSLIMHSISESPHPEGPYTPVDIAIGQRENFWDSLTLHNPTIARDPVDGTWLLYYIGNNPNNETKSVDCGGGDPVPVRADQLPVETLSQRIGLATSKSPSGPWLRRDTPVLDPGQANSWDDLFVTNPSIHVFSNGSVLMLYKGRSEENQDSMSTGVAFADHWSQEKYERKSDTPLNLPSNCEDGGFFWDNVGKMFRMVLHCGCYYQYMHSDDGLSWESETEQVYWCDVSFVDGERASLLRRERPQWLFGKDGTMPTHLITAVEGDEKIHEGLTFTMITRLD